MRDDEAKNGALSVFRRAKERQPNISERVVPMIAVLAEICPGIGELMNGGNDRYGLRGAESLEAAQAQFLPKDFFPSSSYTKATKGAYATGCAVSTEVSVEAAARVDEEVTDDDAASNGAKAKHLRFTKAIEVFVEKDEVSKFLVFSYPGIGTQGGSSIDKRYWQKFTSEQFIGKWFRACASIASGKEGGVSAHMRMFNYAAVTKPIIDEMFSHAGKRAGYNTTLELEYDIEALFGGAFLSGRLDDGGLNVADLGSGVLDGGWDFRGRGSLAYAILDTATVLEKVSREKVEKRPAVDVFKDVRWARDALVDLRNLMLKKGKTEYVLASRDAKTHRDNVPTLEQITAGEFARWLNAQGGLALAAERKRLHETDDSELNPMEKGKKRRMDGCGGKGKQAHRNALAASGVPIAGSDVDPAKAAAWWLKVANGVATWHAAKAAPEAAASQRRALADHESVGVGATGAAPGSASDDVADPEPAAALPTLAVSPAGAGGAGRRGKRFKGKKKDPTSVRGAARFVALGVPLICSECKNEETSSWYASKADLNKPVCVPCSNR